MADDKKDTSDKLSADYLTKAYKINIARKIAAGETKLASELEYLRELENRQKKSGDSPGSTTPSVNRDSPLEDEIGIPERLRIKRPYHMSEAAIKQRQDRRSKGGKASAKKHPAKSWKHGKYAMSSVTTMKPCRTTCEKFPCELIEQNKVKPGEACLDMVFVIQTYEAIINAVKNNEYDGFNEIAAFNISQAIEVLRMCLEDIITDGTIVKSEKIDKEGNVIGFDIKPHPSMLSLPKLLAELGMTPQEAMITPRQIAKAGDVEDGIKSLADLMSGVGKLKKSDK